MASFVVNLEILFRGRNRGDWTLGRYCLGFSFSAFLVHGNHADELSLANEKAHWVHCAHTFISFLEVNNSMTEV